MTKEKPENLKLSSAKEIKKKSEKREEGELVKLPSGIVVRLKEPSTFVMVKSGQIPNDLLQASIKMGTTGAMNKEDSPKYIKFLELMAKASFVEPVMVDANPKSGEITPDDLSDEDKLFIFKRTQGGKQDLSRFRDEPGVGRAGQNMPKVSRKKTK